MAMEAMGLGLAAEEFGAKFYANGMNIGGVAEHPANCLSKVQRTIRESISKTYAGLGNAYRGSSPGRRNEVPANKHNSERRPVLETRKFQKAR